MKKILMMMVLFVIFGCIDSIGQSIKFEASPAKVSLNSEVTYAVYLRDATRSYNIMVRATGGTVDREVIAMPLGTYVNTFKVRWNQVTNSGKVEASLRENISNIPTGATATISNIQVVNDGGGNQTSYSISGPTQLYVLQPGIFRVANYTLDSSKKLEWYDNFKLCDINPVRNLGNLGVLEDEYAIITPLAPSNVGGTNIICLIKNTLTGVQVSPTVFRVTNIIAPVISPSTNIIQNNQNITYTLKDYYPSATITWQAGANMTFVSGQGTANATFKSSGYGEGTVKAIISYNGKNYTAEDSSVQIQTRVDPYLITYNAMRSKIDISSRDLVGSLTFGDDIKGATNFEWSGAFPVEYKGSKTNQTVTIDKKHIINRGKLGMSIWVKASNEQESVLIIYNVSVNGQGGVDPFE